MTIVWTEAATVQPGMRQLSLNPPESGIADVVDAGGPQVIVVYDDGTTRPYARHEDLPILSDATATRPAWSDVEDGLFRQVAQDRHDAICDGDDCRHHEPEEG